MRAKRELLVSREKAEEPGNILVSSAGARLAIVNPPRTGAALSAENYNNAILAVIGMSNERYE